MTLRLPLLWCPDCGHQVVSHLFVVLATVEVVCVFCARRRVQLGGPVVAPLHVDSAGFVPGAAPALPVGEALTLLTALGARPVPATGAAR